MRVVHAPCDEHGVGLREVGEFGDSAALGRDEEDVVADYTEGRGVGLAGDGEVAVEDLGEAAFAGGGLGVGGVGFEDHHPYIPMEGLWAGVMMGKLVIFMVGGCCCGCFGCGCFVCGGRKCSCGLLRVLRTMPKCFETAI